MLMFGHVTEASIVVWLDAPDQDQPIVDLVATDPSGTQVTASCTLDEAWSYTGRVTISGLRPNTDYSVSARYSARPAKGRKAITEKGTFRTLGAPSLKFLLGSCTLNFLVDPDEAFAGLAGAAKSTSPDFMIHCGDQVYGDVPLPSQPDPNHFRDKYRAVWRKKSARTLFCTLPHYMILDDHEIKNDFANDDEHPALKWAAMRAYDEFQHSHNPQPYGPDRYYYSFSTPAAEFFVLDLRSERYASGPKTRMIGSEQLAKFKAWLLQHRERVKFVVTSVPFVCELDSASQADDKWCGDAFRPQREEIITFALKERISRIVFLTGDMHNSLHAKLYFMPDEGDKPKIHELMSSPINQVGVALGRQSMYNLPGVSRSVAGSPGISYRCSVHQFYGEHPNAMLIELVGNRVTYRVFNTRDPFSTNAYVLTGDFEI